MRRNEMNKKTAIILLAATLPIAPIWVQAETVKDCMLTGTVEKSPQAEGDEVNVRFHSIEKYDQEARCRVRRNQKMEFKLPEDPRLQDAPEGSAVQYRYREDSDGSSQTELIRVGTST
jgi:hypothetical protein